MEKSMTALVSCFARAYHFRNNKSWVFRDDFAEKLLSAKEYESISANMSQSIHFFNPSFQGTPQDALRYIVDHELSPSVLARSAFCENALDTAIRLGCRQYILFASGYDSYCLRCNKEDLWVFELDRPEMISDKQQRIRKCGVPICCNHAFVPLTCQQPNGPRCFKKAA